MAGGDGIFFEFGCRRPYSRTRRKSLATNGRHTAPPGRNPKHSFACSIWAPKLSNHEILSSELASVAKDLTATPARVGEILRCAQDDRVIDGLRITASFMRVRYETVVAGRLPAAPMRAGLV